MNKQYVLVYSAILGGIFLFTLGLPVDLDLGWHLRYGEHVYTTGHLLRQNIISSVWPDYIWVQASWGYDLLLVPLFHTFGFIGLSVTAALLTTLTFALLTWSKRAAPAHFLILLAIIFVAHTQPMFIAGIRAQTVSAVLMALSLVLYTSARFRYTPLLFLIWANMHGGFFLGLLILWGLWIVSWLTGQKDAKRGWILIVSTLTPLLNPYGLTLYTESLRHATNTNIASVGEWTPLLSAPFEASIVVIVSFLTCIALYMHNRKKSFPAICILIVLTWLALSAIRFIIPFGIVVTFVLSHYVSDTLPSTHRIIKKILPIFLLCIVCIDVLFTQKYFVLPDTRLAHFNWHTYCQTLGTCSEPLTLALRTSLPRSNGFNTYNWGGYLSYRVPETKLFVDGRMTAWQQNGNYPPIEDAERVVVEKQPITWTRLDSTYHFTWAIVPTNAPIAGYLTSHPQWQMHATDNQFTLFIRKP